MKTFKQMRKLIVENITSLEKENNATPPMERDDAPSFIRIRSRLQEASTMADLARLCRDDLSWDLEAFLTTMTGEADFPTKRWDS